MQRSEATSVNISVLTQSPASSVCAVMVSNWMIMVLHVQVGISFVILRNVCANYSKTQGHRRVFLNWGYAVICWEAEPCL